MAPTSFWRSALTALAAAATFTVAACSASGDVISKEHHQPQCRTAAAHVGKAVVPARTCDPERWTITVRTSDGSELTHEVTRADFDACPAGSRYPDCTN